MPRESELKIYREILESAPLSQEMLDLEASDPTWTSTTTAHLLPGFLGKGGHTI